MVSAIFQRAVREATGTAREEWIARLERTVDPLWSHEPIKGHICETFHLSDEWGEWLAVMYGQRVGRTPVGVTKDAGVQIGVRRTWETDPRKLWTFLMSRQRGAAVDRKRSGIPGGEGVRVCVGGRRHGQNRGGASVPQTAHHLEASGVGQAVPSANHAASGACGKDDGGDSPGNAGRRLHPGTHAAALGGDAGPDPRRRRTGVLP